MSHDKSEKSQKDSREPLQFIPLFPGRKEMSTELEAQAEEQTACVEGIESSQEEFKRKDNYRSIRVGLNSFFKIVSMDGILSSSQGMMSHWVLTPPLTCPNGCTRNPELHNIQALSMSTGSPLNLNVHYFGKRAYFISQVQKKKITSFETRT